MSDPNILGFDQWAIFELNNNNKKEIFEIKYQKITFDNQDCNLIKFRDLTPIFKEKKLFDQNEQLKTLNAKVQHEMLTPLKCIQ